MPEMYLFETAWDGEDEEAELKCEERGRHVWWDEVDEMDRRRKVRGPTG
jgi:hypothetical protein